MFEKLVRLAAVLVLLLAVDMIWEVSFPVLKEVELYTEKLKNGSGITLLQISDFHGSTSGQLIERITGRLSGVRPDAVLITGDLVDADTKDYDNVYTLIGRMQEICPNIFFISGNHEWSNDGKTTLLKKLKAMGVVVLNNKAAVLKINNSVINICGVDDPYKRRDSIDKAMQNADESKYTILLAHSPRIRNRLGDHVPDLILCGHTHGGQVRLPFVGAAIAPGEGLFPQYDKGLFTLENGSRLYIDSGLGTSKLPIRFMNRSQMSLIRIKGE